MPVPALVRLKDPPITPPTVRVLALTVTWRFAPRVTAPVPRFRLLVPVKVKSPFQFWVLLLVSVMAPPEVLSIIPPEIVKVPVPIEVAWFKLRVPAFKVVVPL